MQKLKKLYLSLDSIFILYIISAFLGVSISYGDFYSFHFMLLINMFLIFLVLKKNSYLLNLSNLSENGTLILLIIFLWYLLSLIWAPDINLALKYIFYIFCGMSITINIVSFSSSIKKLNKVVRVLSLMVILEIAVGLVESFSSFRMPISSYSPIAHLFGKEPINYSPTDSLILLSSLRPPTGFRWNTNDLAVCMVISLPFFLCNKKLIVKVFGALSIIILITMTASRAAFLGLILILIIYLALIKKKFDTLLVIFFLALLIIIGMLELSESENSRINEIANSFNAFILFISGELDIGGSIDWRRQLFENGISAFKESFGLGLGAGGSVANQQQIGPVDGRFTSMHNFWIEVLVEGGVLIFSLMTASWIYLIFKLLFISKNTLKYKLKYYSEALVLSLIGFLPAAIAASSTIYFFPMWIMLGLSLSIIAIDRKILKI